jgi:GT2 family glycosyltransferase
VDAASQDAAVAVCVVTRNCEADVEPFLAAVTALTHRPREIVVVDAASSDGTRRALSEAEPDLPLRLAAQTANVGFAAGMNIALALTDAEWILALNADTRPEPGLLTALLERATAQPGMAVGAVTPRLRRFPAAGEPPRLDACGMYVTPLWRHHDRGSGRPDRGEWSRPERVFGATGAAVLLNRAALDDVAVDGEAFASEFHSYREDAELAFRLRERGWEILYEPTARAAHRRQVLPRRRRSLDRQVNFHSLKNRYLLRAYHQSPTNLLWTLLPTLWRDASALLYVLLVERGSLSAYAWLWRHRREIVRRRRTLRARRRGPRGAVERWFVSRGLPI